MVSNKISKLIGILNGTSNYILTEMEHSGKKFSDVLKEAQNSGFAEKNPKNDLNGNDVSSKIKILSSLCFKTHISNNKILVNLTIYEFDNNNNFVKRIEAKSANISTTNWKLEDAEIIDISTEDGDLEDVFIQLTKN